MSFNLSKDISDTERLGYSVGLDLSMDRSSLTPTLLYQIADNIRLISSCSFDSDLGAKLAIGAEYEFSLETKATVQYVETVQNLTEL